MDTDPKSQPAKDAPLTATLKSWWELGLSISTTLVAVLASTGLGKLGQAIALSIATTAFVVTVLLWHRRRNRKVVLNDRIQAYRHWKERVSDSAFRGLYAFGRSDVLPGVERRRAAVALATWVKSERFRFGVISGDVGCGKTSFVNAVASLLEEGGFEVLVCEGLHGLAQPDHAGSAGPGVAQVLSTLRQNSVAKAGGNPFVLILDQFEEFLIRYVLPAERQEFGQFLDEPIADVESRVICAVRSDYLLEMHDLAPALPEPLSTKSLFRLRNFSIEEAEEVILECAERDGLPISSDFANLIAHDLSHGSMIRPAELQIVCSALSGNPSLEAYQAANGSAAILSEYIKQAIEISVDPRLAQIVLRAFCDFDALPPAKTKPQTQAEIAQSLGLDAPAQRQLAHILETLEECRLIASLPQDDQETLLYALVHDYVVGSIATATGDLRTPAEAADQDLRGFIFQFRNDPSTRVPLRKMARLRKLASRALLASPEAKDLLRKSTRSHLTQAGLGALVLALGMSIVWLMPATKPKWEQILIDRFEPDSTHSAVGFFRSYDGMRVWGQTDPVASRKIRFGLWDTHTGKSLVRDSGFAFFLSPQYESLLKVPLHGSVANVVDLSSGTSSAAPFAARRFHGKLFDFPLAGAAFLSDKLLFYLTGFAGDTLTSTARVWSIPNRRVVGALTNVDLTKGFPSEFRLLQHPDRLVLIATHQGHRVPLVWTISQQRDMRQLRALISSSANDSWITAVNEQNTAMATIEMQDDRYAKICLWNLELESLVVCRDLSIPRSGPWHLRLEISFSREGRYVYVLDRSVDGGSLIGVYGAEDLLPPIDAPPRNTMIASNLDESEFVAMWGVAGNSLRLWRGSDHRISVVRNFSGQTVRQVDLSLDAKFLLVTRGDRQVELWDLTRNVLVRRLQRAGTEGASFTADGRTVAVYTGGGTYAIYDGESGDFLASLPIGSIGALIYRDPPCQRYHVWTPEGLVFRYQRGRNIPFFGFVPSRRGPACR